MIRSPFPLEPDAAALDALTAACVAFVREHLLSLPEQPASNAADAGPLAATFREPPPEHGADIADLLARLGPAVARSFNAAGPGYLAFIPGGGLPVAALADYIALSTNRYVGVARGAPALCAIEETVVSWLAQLIGYPPSARGVLTTGGSLSNLIALCTARIARLPEDFLRGVIYASTETHVSLMKAARLAGFPSRNVRLLPVDRRYRLEPGALEQAVREDRQRGLTPFLVVANAGTTNTGAVDPMDAICDLAGSEGLWVHADAAYGGFFRLLYDEGPDLLPGMERCDSIALDPHKGLFLPYGTGCLLVRDGQDLLRAHRSEAGYLRDAKDAAETNFTDLSPELSREFRGLRLWLPLKLYGLPAFRDQLREKLDLARLCHERLRADGRFVLLDEPQLSVVAFRLRPRPGEDHAAAEARDAALLQRVNARQRVFLSSTTMEGRLALRICVLSFRTHRDRIEEALAALQEEAD